MFCFSSTLNAFPSTKRFYHCVTQQRSAQFFEYSSICPWKTGTNRLCQKGFPENVQASTLKLIKGNKLEPRRWDKYLFCVWFNMLEVEYRSLPNHRHKDVIQRQHAALCLKKYTHIYRDIYIPAFHKMKLSSPEVKWIIFCSLLPSSFISWPFFAILLKAGWAYYLTKATITRTELETKMSKSCKVMFL